MHGHPMAIASADRSTSLRLGYGLQFNCNKRILSCQEKYKAAGDKMFHEPNRLTMYAINAIIFAMKTAAFAAKEKQILLYGSSEGRFNVIGRPDKMSLLAFPGG